MAKSDERNLNITLNNQEDEDRVVLSLSTLIRKLKKYLLVWIVAACVIVIVSIGFAAITTHVKKAELTALVSFSYDGIEKGLDPKGMKLDINTIKNPSVIEAALTDLNIDLEQLEKVRQGITFEGRLPKDTIERLTVYDNVLGQSGNIGAAEKILETAYFPTQYTVSFDYNGTDLTDDQAVAVFNGILNEYTNYFYENYGYNESLGTSVTAIVYSDYDYAEAIDVFDNSLDTLKRYIQHLADEDETRFRSSVTGYTFEDLYASVSTIKSIDLDKISSYVIVNNLTKNKDESLAYYEYRIKELVRQRDELEEQLKAYEEAIDKYEKDQVLVFGGAEETNTQTSIASEQYDKMFNQKNLIASSLASTKQQINYYKDRQQALKNNSTGSKSMNEKVEADLAALSVKIDNLVKVVSDTSEDYYKNVTFKNAYNVLVPATNTTSDKISRVVDNAKLPLVVLELLGIMVYFAIAFVQAIISDNNKAQALAEGKKNADDDDDDDADDASDDDNEETEKDEKSDNKNNKKKK